MGVAHLHDSVIAGEFRQDPAAGTLHALVAIEPDGARRWGGMRSESEQLSPHVDSAVTMNCGHCARAMDEAGTMDAWLFYVCRHCDLIWRLTPGDLLHRIPVRGTPPEE